MNNLDALLGIVEIMYGKPTLTMVLCIPISLVALVVIAAKIHGLLNLMRGGQSSEPE
jgi:hypothetical protein